MDGSSLRSGRDMIRVPLIKAIILLSMGEKYTLLRKKMLLRHKVGLMGMACNLCSLQKRLFCLHQPIGGEGGLSLYDIPCDFRWSAFCILTG